ncbi:hypothetical protein ACLB1R_35945 [Escherichia coli]
MEIIMHLSKENVTNVRAQATKGLIYVKKCHGVQTVGPIIEKLVALEPITFLDNIPELRVNPTLEAWKSRNHVLIEKAKKANTKFSSSILCN